MSLRAKLISAFLLLAIVPLSGIVLFSYLTSLAAFRQAVEAETAELTRDITRTMQLTRADFRQRFSRIGSMSPEAPMPEDVAETALGAVAAAMADSSVWIEEIRLIPEATPGPPGPPRPEATPAPRANPDGRPPHLSNDTPAPAWMLPPGQAEEWREVIEHLTTELPKVKVEFERVRQLQAERAERRAEREEQRARERAQLQERADRRRRSLARLFGDDFRSTVRSGEVVLGRLEADISIDKFLRSVLMSTRREKGEIPFAVDPSSEDGVGLYTVNEEDRGTLLELTSCEPDEFVERYGGTSEERLVELGGWIAVMQRDEETGIVFGIARPIGESLAEIRSTAARNFALGGGMISLALLGILPLSGRMTRELNRLTQQVDRLATGDLGARATAGGKDEIGQLARSFNRMASDLEENQERLLEQERDAREREVREELLAAENERRRGELEEARRFQLSLLPRTLPHNDAWEVAVLMRTATEVGGDYYDFAGQGSDLSATVGDAAGHGARAGTMVAVLKTLFSTCDEHCSPETFLDQAAHTVRSMRLDRMTMSMVVAQCRESGVRIAAAGMPSPLVLRASTGEVEEVDLTGLPLGTSLRAGYTGEEIALMPGDCLLLMSDGFAEQSDPHGRLVEAGSLVGYSKVRELFESAAGLDAPGVIERLTEALDRVTDGAPPADDVTFLALRRLS